MAKDEAFAGMVARAREVGADEIAEEALAIADTPEVGVIVTDDPEKGRIERREDMLGHRKLRVETRLKLLACWNPKKYGTTNKMTIGGDASAPPIQVRTEAERGKRLAGILAVAAAAKAAADAAAAQTDGAD